MKREPASQFTIREVTVADTEALRRMQADSWRATYPNDEHGVSQAWVEGHVTAWLTPDALEKSRSIVEEAINDRDGFYRLAEHDGEVVGFVRATTRDDGAKELKAIYIRPDMFGRGLGGQLMSRAMAWIGDESDAVLEVVSYNQRAIRFYEKFGFEKVAGSERMYRDKMPVMTMIRKGAA